LEALAALAQQSFSAPLRVSFLLLQGQQEQNATPSMGHVRKPRLGVILLVLGIGCHVPEGCGHIPGLAILNNAPVVA
jgi:hypothetical protein